MDELLWALMDRRMCELVWAWMERWIAIWMDG